METYSSVDDLKAAIGRELGPTEWFTVDQDRVNLFADATEDHQWIHLDVERAKSGPFGGTVAHGFLTLSLVPMFANQLRTVERVAMGINYGMNKVRFPSPVPVGSRIRGRFVLTELDEIGASAVQMVATITIEVEGSSKPACVAEMVSRYYFES